MSEQVTVSPKYQIVIPKSVRDQVPSIKPGRKVAFIVKHGSIRLLPVPTLDELYGFAKGINIEGYRDEEDRY
jgi:AbrB family looped-hinge helix DNA binding protein